MTPEQQMEQLSIAYVRAVAAQAGWNVVDNIYPPRKSIDGMLMSELGNRPVIEYQLKSTADDIMRDDGLHYPLSVKDYNDLRIVDPAAPRILIVMLTPKNEAERVSQTHDELRMRRCCYWTSLEGMPPTQNVRSITVILPVDNIFDVALLNKLWSRIHSEGE